MIEFHKKWIEQCEAAHRIRDEFGAEKALGYLIGEKLACFIREADQRPEFQEELPGFAAAIKQMFDQEDIANYLESLKRVGPLCHTLTDEQYELFEEAGAVDVSPARWAEDVLVIERIKGLILE